MSLVATFLLAHTLCFGTPDIMEYGISCVPDRTQYNDSTSVTAKRDSIVEYAKTFLGTPYKYAQSSPNSGFDCSGFTYYVYNHFNVAIPRSSKDYASLGTRVTLETCRKGDIILFTGTDPSEKRVGHVGIIISEPGDTLQFIHSSSSDNHFGVVITNYYQSRYPQRFIGVCSVLP